MVLNRIGVSYDELSIRQYFTYIDDTNEERRWKMALAWLQCKGSTTFLNLLKIGAMNER
ncbi:MAG: hypothetical protein WBZ36_28340 [Candidatus Nitrosopolaris sp.]